MSKELYLSRKELDSLIQSPLGADEYIYLLIGRGVLKRFE